MIRKIQSNPTDTSVINYYETLSNIVDNGLGVQDDIATAFRHIRKSIRDYARAAKENLASDQDACKVKYGISKISEKYNWAYIGQFDLKVMTTEEVELVDKFVLEYEQISTAKASIDIERVYLTEEEFAIFAKALSDKYTQGSLEHTFHIDNMLPDVVKNKTEVGEGEVVTNIKPIKAKK